MKKCAAIVLLALSVSACVSRTPILFYKDSAESNPQKLPLRAGLMIENADAIGKNVKVGGGISASFPIIPLYFARFRAEFPKDREKEFMSDMIRQYFVDSGIFDYIYPFPFKNMDTDIILKVRINSFHLRNSKFYNYLKNSIFPFVPVIGQFALLVLPNEKYSADFDFSALVLLPNGKVIHEYNVKKSGKQFVGFAKEPYGKYLFYKSIFKRVFLKVMDEIKEKVLIDRDEIIQAYKNYLVEE